MIIEENNSVFESGLLKHAQFVVLRQWNVDFSDNHGIDRVENYFLLKNRRALYGVDNLVIAPGYSNP